MLLGLVVMVLVPYVSEALNDSAERGPIKEPAAAETSHEALFEFVQYGHLSLSL